MIQARPLALNINFDSLSECLKLVRGLPTTDFRDPCFFEVMDRFLLIAAEYDAPLTIFVIGRDLENNANAEAVARWHEMGHEIGNHSYSHRQDLYLLPRDQVSEEIEKAHELIAHTTGTPPRGFIAPGWTACDHVVNELRRLNYLYDTSLAPTWLLLISQVALRLKSPGGVEMIPWLRADWRACLFGRRHPYVPKVDNYLRAQANPGRGLPVMLPLPTVPWLRMGIWHTLSFINPRLYHWLLEHAIRSSQSPYYLMHPSDLIDPDMDLAGFGDDLRGIQRMSVPLTEKEAHLRRALELLTTLGRFVRMSDIAQAMLNADVRPDLSKA